MHTEDQVFQVHRSILQCIQRIRYSRFIDLYYNAYEESDAVVVAYINTIKTTLISILISTKLLNSMIKHINVETKRSCQLPAYNIIAYHCIKKTYIRIMKKLQINYNRIFKDLQAIKNIGPRLVDKPN